VADRGDGARAPYGQTFRSVRQRPDSEDGSALPEIAPHSYGQSFSSVRDGPDSRQRSGPPANTPLLPRGVRKPRRSSPRLQSFDYTGPFAYSITINTDDGRSYFSDPRFVRFCIKTLHEKAATNGFEVLAYCFMPNHIHLLVVGLTETSCLKPFMQQFKQITGYAFRQERGVSLWHRSYHERVLRREESMESVAAYIWANPVQAGLVKNPEDYPYSGPTERLAGQAKRPGDEAALGGQSLSSVRTDARPRLKQA